MLSIVFATSNPNKTREVKEMLPEGFAIKSLQEIGCTEEVPETSPTIEGNAIQKAHYVRDNYGVDCFAEDTGLEVTALDGDPGVYSARYAGPQRDATDNMDLLLKNLADKSDRSARFKTVIAFTLNGQTHTFTGIVNGTIATKKTGKDGFGYDPIFLPENHKISFAEMDKKQKNEISHRGRAMAKFLAFLDQLPD
ncbi:MAG: non-canonical purine NTP diphosphatase [Saprospiraceae bacterium]